MTTILSPISFSMLILIVFMLTAAGCTTTPISENRTAGATTPNITPLAVSESNTSHQSTPAQPNNPVHHDFIKMDSEVYTQGEIIQFYLVNEGVETLICNNTPPSVSIFRQTGNNSWEIQLEFEETKVPAITYVKSGESTRIHRITTANLLPGRYKIVFDCGVSREFEIRSL